MKILDNSNCVLIEGLEYLKILDYYNRVLSKGVEYLKILEWNTWVYQLRKDSKHEPWRLNIS